jgi:hypothetical protein
MPRCPRPRPIKVAHADRAVERRLDQTCATRARALGGRFRRQRLERAFDLVRKETPVGQPRRHGRPRAVGAAVDEVANDLGRDPAPGRDSLHELVVEIVREGLELLAVLGRHAIAREPLPRALVAPDANHLRLDVEPIEDATQKQRFEAQPHQEDVAGLRQPELGRRAGDEKALGLQRLRVDHDGDARLAQAQNGAAKGRHLAHAVNRARDVQEHAVDLGIFRRGVQRLEDVQKARRRAASERQGRHRELLEKARQTHHQPEAVAPGQRRPVEHAACDAGEVPPGATGDLGRSVRHQDLRFLRPFR